MTRNEMEDYALRMAKRQNALSKFWLGLAAINLMTDVFWLPVGMGVTYMGVTIGMVLLTGSHTIIAVRFLIASRSPF